MSKKNNYLIESILNLISNSDLDLFDTVEVLANVFIKLGFTYIDIGSEKVNQLTIANIVLNDIEKNGETLPNSLIRQGLIMLSWLKRKENV